MKRLFLCASIAFVVIGAAGCTREKPATTPGTPAVAETSSAPTPALPSGAVSPIPPPVVAGTTTPPSLAAVTPAPTDLAPPALPTTPPTFTPGIAGLATGTPLPPVAIPAAPTSPAPGLPTTYTVQWGDWLNKIAQRFGVTTQAILQANPGMDPNRLTPGQTINIPAAGGTTQTPLAGATSTPSGASAPSTSGPTTYTVQRGDWFYAIARKFNISVTALQAANPGVNPNLLTPGQVLNIPGNTSPSSPAPQVIPGSSTNYTVQPGDTLFSIALKFHTTAYAIQIKNNLSSTSFIYPGQVLALP